MRAVIIAIGAALLSLFSFVFQLFGLLLIYTAVQLFRHRNEYLDVQNNLVLRTARRVLPVADQYAGGRRLELRRGQQVSCPLEPLGVLPNLVLQNPPDLGIQSCQLRGALMDQAEVLHEGLSFDRPADRQPHGSRM